MVAVAAARAVTAMSDGGAGVEGADSRRSPPTAAAAGAAKRKRPKTITAERKRRRELGSLRQRRPVSRYDDN
jgi:hypothetical protein